MTDYSQSGEQAAILKACGDTVGRYLDIGAYHPTTFSNTRALWERGWSGVMVEPSPLPFEALLREYGNDDRVTLICAAVGSGEMVTLHATQDALSTTDDKWFRELSGRSGYKGGFYGSFLTPTVTVHQLMQFGAFDFVSIDTEGSSEDVFLDYLMCAEYLARCVCVEQKEPTEQAKRAGYRVEFQNDTNIIYVKR